MVGAFQNISQIIYVFNVLKSILAQENSLTLFVPLFKLCYYFNNNYLILLIIHYVGVHVWVGFLHTAMCRVRNPACTATSSHGKERYING